MTLIEKITEEIRMCDNELNDLDLLSRTTKIRIDECNKRRNMLVELLDSARNEDEKPSVTEKKPTSSRKKKTPTADNNSSAQIVDPTLISMKELAQELGVEQSIIAKNCTALNYNDEMISRNYMLTKEQADNIRTRITCG